MALTKTLKFDDETLNVIRRMDWSDTGMTAVIHETLDRPLYEKVNKALTAMGGKWSRSIKAHVFKTDPRALVEGLLEAGSLTVARDGFFETPRAVVERMLELVPMKQGATVLEPSAGLGAIVRVLREYNQEAFFTLIEKNHDRALSLEKEFGESIHVAVVCGNFLDFPSSSDVLNGYERIYMNPPFEEGQDIEHVVHAYNILVEGGKMIAVMSEGVFFRRDRLATEFRNWLDVVGGRDEKLPEGSFKESGTGVNTRLVWIVK
jgi:hypothetical protein